MVYSGLFFDIFHERDDAMVKTVTPSECITSGQIGKIQELLGAGLRKSGLPAKETRDVLENQGGLLAEELVAVVRRHAEMNSNLIVRPGIKVNRKLTPQEALKATGRVQYVDQDAANTMPLGEGDEVEVVFFKPGPEAYKNGVISDDEVQRQCAFRELEHDPRAQAAANQADPAFADEHPNGISWKGSDGKWYYVAFYRDYVKRDVDCYRSRFDWGGCWWFAGVRKYQKKSSDA